MIELLYLNIYKTIVLLLSRAFFFVDEQIYFGVKYYSSISVLSDLGPKELRKRTKKAHTEVNKK